MAAPSSGGGPVIESKDQLIAWFAEGEKPREAWRIGTEHEKFAFRQSDHAPLSYDGSPGIRDLLEGLQRFGCLSSRGHPSRICTRPVTRCMSI
jgi:glutamate--cysteine ligase